MQVLFEGYVNDSGVHSQAVSDVIVGVDEISLLCVVVGHSRPSPSMRMQPVGDHHCRARARKAEWGAVRCGTVGCGAVRRGGVGWGGVGGGGGRVGFRKR